MLSHFFDFLRWNLRTLIFYLIFQGIHVALFAVGWYVQVSDSKLAILNKLQYSVWISRGAALVLSLDASLILLPKCRTTLRWARSRFPWLHLDESEWFHRQVAYSLLFYSCLHVGSHYVNFFNIEHLKLRPVLAVQVHYTEAGPITGHIMVFCMILMFTSAHPKIRRESYEAFRHIHYLFIVFYLGLLCHGVGCFVRDTPKPFSPFDGHNFWTHCLGYQSWRWEMGGVVLYIFDRLLRVYNSFQPARIVGILCHPSNVVEVRFHKDSLDFKSGQWLFAKFPSISANQWHPFTISSSPFDPFISIHVHQAGDFTGAFAESFASDEERLDLERLNTVGLAKVKPKPGQHMPKVRIDGPFGSPAEDVFNYEVAVMIGGGIGVTPWASILKTVWHMRKNPDLKIRSRLRRLEFIWVCKDIVRFQWFQGLIDTLDQQSAALEGAEKQHNNNVPIVCCHTFITRKVDPSQLQFAARREPIRTDSTGTPITGSRRTLAADLQAIMPHGRPNFKDELTKIRNTLVRDDEVPAAKKRFSKPKVGVFFSGPQNAATDVQRACKDVSDHDIKFEFWREHG